MPAAAVIPAPIACTNVVAVKKLVVEFLVGVTRSLSQDIEKCVFSGHFGLSVKDRPHSL